jgi:16S rRNA (guanine527-N7)-methyltransferase
LGNEAREGHGETRPRTGRATEDRGPRAVRRTTTPGAEPGRPAQARPTGGCLDRPRDPLPTRVDSCPPLPAAYGDALDGALNALGIRLGADARTAIDGHVRLLLAWNAAINLTAIRDPAAIAIRHVVDSLTALPLLAERGIDRFVDLGSGGGFPGLTLAAALPADRALLVDSVAKKVRFLATVAEATDLSERVAAIADRAEALAADPLDRGRWPAVMARAVGSLAELIELAFPLLQPGGILVAWKRGSDDDPAILGGEIAAGRRALGAIDPDGRIAIVPAIDPRNRRIAAVPALVDLVDHRLVIVERGSGPIAATWPRDPATRHRRPW